MKRLTIISILLSALAVSTVGCSAKQDVIATPDSATSLKPLPSVGAEQPSVGATTPQRDGLGLPDAGVGGGDAIGALPELDSEPQSLPAQ